MTPDYVDCRRVESRLDAYVDGEASMVERLNVEAHLRWCKTCRAHVDDVRGIGGILRRSARGAEPGEAVLDATRAAVVARAASEREQTWMWRLRIEWEDRRLLWPGIVATCFVTVAVGVTLGVLHIAASESPTSLARMIQTLSRPGSEQNPMVPAVVPSIAWGEQAGRMVENRSSGGVSIPRVLDDRSFVDIGPSGEGSEITVSAVVNRQGRVANYALLRTSGRGLDTSGTSGVRAVQDAVRLSRFRPAQMPTGEAVAVNVIWLIVHQTVRGSFDPPPLPLVPPTPLEGVLSAPTGASEPAAAPPAGVSPTA